MFEITLAQVKIVKGKSYIEAYQITDERLNKTVCGIVNSLIQADTTTIFNQFKHWFDSRTADFEKEWERLAGRNEGQGGGKFGVTSVNGKTGDVILMAKHVGAPSINDLRAYALKGEPAGQYTPTFLNGWYVQAGEVKGVCYYKDQFGYVQSLWHLLRTKTEFGTPLFNSPGLVLPKWCNPRWLSDDQLCRLLQIYSISGCVSQWRGIGRKLWATRFCLVYHFPLHILRTKVGV
ncbi:hypothetical protein P7H21_19740 [Paenibacillus larvae]|nr:hypothetical protein [Paenibacillus larvae]MDT2305724.1 hypothetical protein [Paenibacillus larvae]